MAGHFISFRISDAGLAQLQGWKQANESDSLAAKRLLIRLIATNSTNNITANVKTLATIQSGSSITILDVDAAIVSAIAPLEARLEQLEALKPETPTTANSETLTQVQLARLLDVSAGRISQLKGSDDFPEWTRRKSKDGTAWRYNDTTQTYHRVTDATTTTTTTD